MTKSNRYTTSHLIEDQYESGSGKRVLKNLLGIKSKREIDRIETLEQFRALEKFTRIFDHKYRFTVKDICKMHKIWLGNIYEWAGTYRRVNISKGGFSFASAQEIPKLMDEFEQKVLSIYTPCRFKSKKEIASAMAIVHTELVLIHPFREGNGRVARLLSILQHRKLQRKLSFFCCLESFIAVWKVVTFQDCKFPSC